MGDACGNCDLLLDSETPIYTDVLQKVEKVEVGVEEPNDTPVAPVRVYTREKLLHYQNSPLSQRRPVVLNQDIAALSCWKRESEDELKKRLADPRERVRRENDGIVLSPQRGANFKLGCSVPPQQPPQSQHHIHQNHQRRIGSGRLLNREWDGVEERADFEELGRDGFVGRRKKYNSFSSDDNRGRQDRQGRIQGSSGVAMFRTETEAARHDGRGPRPTRTSNSQMQMSVHPQQQQGRRQHEERRSSRHSSYSETPEWFTEGPTSRHDRIDLHGFDGPSPDQSEMGTPLDSSTPIDEFVPSIKETINDPSLSSISSGDSEPTITESHNFNFDDFLQFDVVSPLLAEIDIDHTSQVNENKQTQSKFSQFFNSQNNQVAGNVVPPHTINHQRDVNPHNAEDSGAVGPWALGNVEKNSGETDAAAAFISAFCKEQPQKEFGIKLKDLAETLKIPSVDELEARVLASASANHGAAARGVSPNSQPQPQVDHNRVPDRRNLHAQQAQLIYLAQQQNQQRQQQPQMLFPVLRDGLPPMPPELQYLIANAVPTPDIINRNDYITIVNGVKQGVISAQHLVNLLLKASGVMHPRQRDVLLCVLNLIWTSHRSGSPIAGREPLPTHPLSMQQNGAIPSRNDLVAHTASIMQSALIKKKLEEQLENYKKRQETGDLTGPPRNPSPNAHSALAFTPTAVLRKMTATSSHAHDAVQRSNAPSPMPFSPVRSSSPVHHEHKPDGPLMVGSGFGIHGPLSPSMMQSGHGGLPMNAAAHLVRPPPMHFTPQAFIGQFLQPNNPQVGGGMANGQWWNTRPPTPGFTTHVPPPNNMAGSMMTVEELERAQQRPVDRARPQ